MSISLKSLLLEISENNTLYHRSPLKLKTGDIITPKLSDKGEHWAKDKFPELALEEIRKQDFPDKPSRFNCIFSSLIPRSRFVDKGYLYHIKAKGKMLITNSLYIDEYNESFDRDLYDHYFRGEDSDKYYRERFKQHPKEMMYIGQYWLGKSYWTGVSPTKNLIRDIEVLSDSAIVLEEIIEDEKSTPIRKDDNVIVTEDDKLMARIDFYINSDTVKNKEKYTDKDIIELKEWSEKFLFSKIKKIDPWPFKKDEYGGRMISFNISGYLKKDAKLKIISIESSMTRSDMDSSEKTSKYSTIMFDFYKDGKLISRDSSKNEKSISHRFICAMYLYYDEKDKMYDFSKYLRKI